MSQRQRWVLARRPDGVPQQADFALETMALTEPGEGEVRVAVRHISIDPGMRSRLSGDSYAAALGLGETIESAGIGVIEASRDPRFPVGAWVSGRTGWQSHVIGKPKGLSLIDPTWLKAPLGPTTAIGVLGIPGLTAYFGLLDLGQPKDGETLLVSSVAGTVGATAAQIGKILGLKVIGIAGGADKCAYARDVLKLDGVIDYKAGNVHRQIRALTEQGVDIYFDNVGAQILDAAIAAMRPKGRLVISGQIAEYNRSAPIGIRNTLAFITHRLRMEGLVVYDYAARFGTAQAAMATWIREGALTYRETMIDGLERAPEAFIGLFEGAAIGRVLIKLR